MQTHEEYNNSMRTRNVGVIALRPKGKSQGGFYFLSLTTVHRIDRHNWTNLPMPNKVIDRVHALALYNKAANGITFGWRDSTLILENEDDDNGMPDPDYNPYQYDSEDDDDYDSEDDGDDDAGANNPQPMQESTTTIELTKKTKRTRNQMTRIARMMLKINPLTIMNRLTIMTKHRT